MGRLSQMSSSEDSGIHSLSSPSTPKKRQISEALQWPSEKREIESVKEEQEEEKKGVTEEEEIPTKKIRREKENDAFVPRSTSTSEESLERTPPPAVTTAVEKEILDEKVESVEKNGCCASQPSTSSQPPAEVILEKENEHLEESEEKELIDLQDTDIVIPCRWGGCKQGFPCINTLYDHVVSLHMEEMAMMEKDEEEEIECLWKECEMSMARGDWQKKVKWLQDHFRSRHARYAEVYKCVMEGCSFRSVTTKKVEEHVRKEHIVTPKKPKREWRKTRAPSWAGWQQRRYWPRTPEKGEYFPFNRAINVVIQERLCRLEEAEGKCRLVNKRRAGAGAAHRKCRMPVGVEVVPISPKKEEEPIAVDTSYQKLTLDDLFPGYNYEEKKKEKERKELEEKKIAEEKERDERRYQKWREEHERTEAESLSS